jgi:para-nitrobenzyl esterase
MPDVGGRIGKHAARVCSRVLIALLLSVAVQFAARAQPSAPVTIVKTLSGAIEGAGEHDVLAFKGIPYAAPPVGELRWRDPSPAAPWPGVRSGRSYGNACTQPAGLSQVNGGDPGPVDEDCLYLNVWTPQADPSAKLPVMVWIHGGAYLFGSGALSLYQGAPLSRRGAVVVTINYRLGQLGFFVHPALEQESHARAANFGLLDQIAALRWVQQNIAAFGGDPGNVTIFGQSAGARSVMALIASPLARGLFHKGIAESSYVLPDASPSKARRVGINVANALGLPGANATAAALRAVPAQKFSELSGKELSTAPVPIRGDKVLPQSIEAVFAAGKEAPLPLILGNTSDDVSVVRAFGVDPSKVFDRLGAAGFLVKLFYPGVEGNDEIARQATRDAVFTMPVRWAADRHARIAPTWRYYFDYVAVGNRDKFPNGVPHGGELPFVLDTGDLYEGTRNIFVPEDRAFAQQISGYWLGFARSGKPAANGPQGWAPHSRSSDRTMVFAERSGVQSNFMRRRLNAFMAAGNVLEDVRGRE